MPAATLPRYAVLRPHSAVPKTGRSRRLDWQEGTPVSPPMWRCDVSGDSSPATGKGEGRDPKGKRRMCHRIEAVQRMTNRASNRLMLPTTRNGFLFPLIVFESTRAPDLRNPDGAEHTPAAGDDGRAQ